MMTTSAAVADEVLRALREVNAAHPGQSWTFYLNIDDPGAPTLSIGLRGEVGIVSWWDGTHQFVPADTVRTGEFVDYSNGGHHHQADRGGELPQDQVLAVLVEFLSTRQRPRVQWKRAA